MPGALNLDFRALPTYLQQPLHISQLSQLMENTKSIPQNINFGIKVEVLKDILKENKISFENGNSFWFKSSQVDIAELSKDSSVVINCHAEKKRN